MHNDAIYRGNEKKTDYNLNLLWGEKEKCEYIDLKHDFQSSFYNFDSTILLECKPRTKAYNLEININTNSPEWDMLNSKTRQVFYLERHLEGWETMNFSHPAINIDAEGKIGMDFEGPFYDKKYHIKSKTDVLPSYEITYSSKLTSTPYMELNIEVPEDGFKNIKYRTDIARDGSGFSIVGTHVHTDKPEEVKENLAFALKLLSPFTISLKGYEDLKFSMEIAEKLHPRLVLLSEKIEAIVKDRNHPINVLIKSLRKQSKKQEEFYRNAFEKLKENRKEIRELLYPFIQPTVEMIRNIRREADERTKQAQDNYESFTVAANAFRNIDYQGYANKAVTRIPQESIEAIKSYLTSRENNIVKYQYTGPHPFYWQNLFQVPQPWEGTYRSPVFYLLPHLNKEILFKRRYIVSPIHKTAMIFGTSHMYTFDGKMYEFPDFPGSDCTYMLAHDVRESTFSVLLSEQKLHILFPEVTVTLDRDNKIYLNNSRQESGVPIETPNGKVFVTREGGIVSINSIGLKVLCNSQRSFCVFILDPLYHSGTIGLLGNADGEAYNDFSVSKLSIF
ncbi:apolipophorins-like [Centruroides sculpturatus]|uniref:apolipophorins-like n=1 Tax=Centruroides sculpturatus TaxID=218467 RepID=UPI000C6E55EA|nr:apolipophorins-like [Centruroides sculpturatus]